MEILPLDMRVAVPRGKPDATVWRHQVSTHQLSQIKILAGTRQRNSSNVDSSSFDTFKSYRVVVVMAFSAHARIGEWGVGGGVRRTSPRLRFFFFFFLSEDQLAHTFSTLFFPPLFFTPGISPQWHSELRRLWTSVPRRVRL